MGFSPSLSLYKLFSRFLARGQTIGLPSPARSTRPPGALIWVHAPHPENLEVALELITRLADRSPDMWFLLTTCDEFPDTLPDQCFHEILQRDTPAAMADFLDYWQPGLVVWATGELYPTLTQLAVSGSIKLVLLDTGAAFDAAKTSWVFPGLTRRTLRKFDIILSGDEATSVALISAGARSKTVHTIGVLENGIEALPCNDAEWTVLASLLATRPVWLAAEIDVSELAAVILAHRHALRRSHRLLLIVVPADEDAADEFALQLNQQRIAFSRRSIGDEPTREDQVYLADTDEEMGLWYRLAPVAFIGQTLAGDAGKGPDPFNAAALGSVVIHGPMIAPQQINYHRLGRAGAAKSVANARELATEVEALLAPDLAASMAHAAWQISTAGAEVMERTLGFLERAQNGKDGAE